MEGGTQGGGTPGQVQETRKDTFLSFAGFWCPAGIWYPAGIWSPAETGLRQESGFRPVSGGFQAGFVRAGVLGQVFLGSLTTPFSVSSQLNAN